MTAPLKFRMLDRTIRRVRGKPINQMSLEEIRQARGPYLPETDGRVNGWIQKRAASVLGQRAPGVTTTEITVPGAVGDLPARRHEPVGEPGADRPLFLHLHGGGWVIGSPIQYDPFCTRIAADCDAVVISVDYRKAPEHMAPAAPDDARAVARWLAGDGAAAVGATGPMAVGGDSAGGNLSALVALDMRDANLPLAAQVLIYPGIDMTRSSASINELTDEPILRADDIDGFIELYLGDQEPNDPAISPWATEDVRGVAPALVITAERDPLRDEGRMWADRLRAAGVEVRFTQYRDMPHGFVSMPGLSISARQAVDEIVEFTRHHLTSSDER